ncbi:CaiB/BaiF CoA-transferase family protein [Sphingomonas jatrophae]|uniref:Crotonobetainyl-CoA:carnitine CoA-transferase CaiB n=1 Tax=Sphingomonas jatrophae TaxID=1166337 RepID=A0A1I6KCR1_9SPHN|nr:CoA transferase [Sphingomonas jatrophae]SFR88976.1 Crotonobetainyl-CoA:carnitine CoA-transferase CaiB [Sphingomonas jatrophae]
MTDAQHGVDRPLAGMTILDLLEAPLAGVTRTYVELGARVVRPEPGGAYAGAAVNSPEGVRWLVANVGKTLIDGTDAELRASADQADMIVQGAGGPAEALLSDGSRAAVPVLTVSMFGTGTSYEGWQATDPVLHALTGELSRSGLAPRAPLLPPGELAMQCAMAQAAYVGMAALYAAKRTGQGDRIDVSMLDAAGQALDPGYGISGSATLGRAASHLPPERPVKGFQYPIFPCRDGDVRLCLLAPRQWRNMFDWMGQPEAFAGVDYNNTGVRQRSAALTAALAAFVQDKSRAELEREGMARGIPISGLLSLDECLKAPHLAARQAIGTVHDPSGVEIRSPDGVIEIDGVRMSPRVSAGIEAAAMAADVSSTDPARPLAGIRVLDLGVIVVGGEQSRLLADLGADVVKVESAAFPDGTRHSYLPTGLSVSFAAGHRNKRSLGLNLRDDAGKALFCRLAAKADVILSNFKPGTMEALGLGYDRIAAINPGIVMVESSAFGSTGPWAGRMGYGPLVRAAAGLTGKWRYPDDPTSYSDSITIYPDHVGARYGTIAVLALLARRLRTGRGGRAAISQLEVMLGHFAAEIAGESVGVSATAALDAPWNVFRAQGDDEWCVVTVRGDADWLALARLLDRPDWTGTAYASAAQRLAQREAIERDVAAWMATQDAEGAMRRLQAAGIPAARMLRIADLPDFSYYRERGFFRVDRHPHMDEPVIAERRHAVSALLAEPDTRPAPLMGEHGAEVLRDWLGLSAAEIADLTGGKVIEPVSADIARMVAAGEGRAPA